MNGTCGFTNGKVPMMNGLVTYTLVSVTASAFKLCCKNEATLKLYSCYFFILYVDMLIATPYNFKSHR